MKPLLASPLHFFVSKHILLISFVGRKSGKTYTTPVEYRRENDELMIFTQADRKWWRNFIGGADVQLTLQGQHVTAHAEPFTADQLPLNDMVSHMYPYLSEAHSTELAKTSVCIKLKLSALSPA